MLFICYPRCTTCKKAQKWLDDNGIAYESRDISLDNPAEEELRRWHSVSGLPLRRFFNTSGMRYRELALKDRLPGMSEDEQLAILATDGMLVKRPILIDDNLVLVGFRQADWEEKLGK